jgi:melanoma-associated antigen
MEIDDEDEDGESQDQLVKKLVRYALACEYSRQPIRREGIRDKGINHQRFLYSRIWQHRGILTYHISPVFGKNKAPFKRVFDAAQTQLRTKFGMEMTELPQKEKVTLKDRRGKLSPRLFYLLTSTRYLHLHSLSGAKVTVLIFASPRLV